VDLNSLVDEALNLAYHGARAQDQNLNISLEREFDPVVMPFELAPQEITRVCLNLFSNGFYAAAKRARDGDDATFTPAVKVTTRDLGDAAEIRIRDWRRHPAGGQAQAIPAVLHDQTDRRRHRARSLY
jgi:two-component system NtrC family sensor kinase